MNTMTTEVSPSKKIMPIAVAMVLFGYLLHEIVRGDWSDIFVIFQAGMVCFVPYFLDRKFNIVTPHALYVGIVLFVLATLLLGTVSNFYIEYWWWDFILHGVAGGGITIIGFIILVLFFEKQNAERHAYIASVFAFTFSLSLSVLWEVYEFFIDIFFSPELPMQVGNTDTMTDLIAAAIGGLVATGFAYPYLRYRCKNVVGEIIEEGEVKNCKEWKGTE